MTADERHERIKQLDSEIKEALRLREQYQTQFDHLYAEREQLETECFDEFCPCVEQDADGNNRCTSGQSF
jgi:hypothetical protein